MPQPLVSVIVPAYNAAGFISRCVESITSQSYPELEILLLNDGSTDDTLAVCRKLAAADSRIRVVDKPNTGAADTRSCGLALAHGEYIQFAACPLQGASMCSLWTATITCCRAAPQTWWLLCSAAMPTLCWLPTG